MENNFKLIRKVYLTSLFPNIIAVLGGTINVFFDGILVGQKLGENGLESVNQCLPVYLLLCTIGSLVASGASCLSAVAFGENNRQEGQRIFSLAFWISILLSVVFCSLGLIFAEPLADILATEESYSYVLCYMQITLIGGIFKVLLYVPYFYLRLEGKHNRSMIAMLTMTVLNIVLDYLFLFVFELGIGGAAWASVIATIVACMMSFVFLLTDHSNFKITAIRVQKNDLYEIVKYGSPMALNNIVSAVRIFVVNMILKAMGIIGLTAVFAIVNNLNEFSICVQNGVPQTAGAMTGIFFGEKDSTSVKKLLNTQLLTGIIFSGFLCMILLVFSGQAGLLFGSTIDSSFAVKCFAVSLIFGTVNNIMSYYFNIVERTGMSNFITICRGCVLVIISCMLFCRAGERVWLFYPVSEILTMLLFLAMGEIIAAKNHFSRFYLLDESFEHSGKATSFSVECSEKQICDASEKIRVFCEENEFSPKKTMVVSLAIEEILTIIASRSLKGQGTMDVRVLNAGEDGIVRIRSGGKRYNPMEVQDESLDYMGVRMIAKLAKKIEYQSTLGVNTLVIFI